MDLIETPAMPPVVRHPWETARFNFFTRLLRQYIFLNHSSSRVLDVGAGDGWFSIQFIKAFGQSLQWVCWDKGYATMKHPPQSPATLNLTWCTTPPSGRFDTILLLDVLEHIEQDETFLKQVIQNHLNPGGFALISVPAWPVLFSSHDRFLRHHRRYTPAQARAIIRSSGLKIHLEGGLFHSLMLVRELLNLREHFFGEKNPAQDIDWRHGRGVTTALDIFLGIDTQLSALFARWHLQVPGLSWWALCQRSSS